MHSLMNALRPYVAALRMLLVFTVLLGVIYPLAITVAAQMPGLKTHADGSLITRGGRVVGSKLIGQSFTGTNGRPLPQYFQSRPSAAGAGYDPTASGASNRGPESIVDTLPDPAVKGDTGHPSLLTQVCARSVAYGELYGVDGSRPFCAGGVGAVLAVFWSGPGYHGTITRVVSLNQTAPATPFVRSYKGVRVQLATFGTNYAQGQVVPIRGDAPARPAVPAGAVTASGSGLDPEISPANADIQERLVARTRGITVAQVSALVARYEKGRDLGFMGEARVNVLQLNLALDTKYPYRA
ncbi:MAG: potassium-transporting ATPase subunit C [Jatrophihabitantaceae bacterium]